MLLGNSTVSLILDDRKQKTMARMFTAPVRSSEIALGNFLGGWLVGTLQIALILVMTMYVLKVDLNISFLDQFIVMECFLLTALGLASTVAGLIRNMNNVGVANMLIIIPSFMLGVFLAGEHYAGLYAKGSQLHPPILGNRCLHTLI
ncbi:ABC transporter permease [Paenibacillus larvae]|nr:ABC transporter permease [Paenibacillus larvae]MDT2194054.1 ABC transporter permease [Paenibacillus larvae]MDT2255250.1 ABC transporter permease [Paenibacillus larvae]MDT2262154.1 ABC transporter permease [Paenibacillus larvae]MDT2265685.1 ABC transporter permease [Paenibacillus larvae]MDT2276941.1 ABC transporter permease [Paenibacillus larvae]